MNNWYQDVSNLYQPQQTGITMQLGNTQNLFSGLVEEQRRMNELQMQREDTAYQRMVADMKSAGLNPWSGINTGGSSSSSYQSPLASGLNSLLQALSFNLSSTKTNNDTALKIAKIALPFLALFM